jgi:hypothetical protein
MLEGEISSLYIVTRNDNHREFRRACSLIHGIGIGSEKVDVLMFTVNLGCFPSKSLVVEMFGWWPTITSLSPLPS